MTDYVAENFDRERWQPDTIIPKGAKKALRIHQFAGEGLELRDWYLGIDGLWYPARAHIKLKVGEGLLLAQAITEAAEARKGARGGYKGDRATPLPVRSVRRADAAQ